METTTCFDFVVIVTTPELLIVTFTRSVLAEIFIARTSFQRPDALLRRVFLHLAENS
jgi:hypothetical protein